AGLGSDVPGPGRRGRPNGATTADQESRGLLVVVPALGAWSRLRLPDASLLPARVRSHPQLHACVRGVRFDLPHPDIRSVPAFGRSRAGLRLAEALLAVSPTARGSQAVGAEVAGPCARPGTPFCDLPRRHHYPDPSQSPRGSLLLHRADTSAPWPIRVAG